MHVKTQDWVKRRVCCLTHWPVTRSKPLTRWLVTRRPGYPSLSVSINHKDARKGRKV